MGHKDFVEVPILLEFLRELIAIAEPDTGFVIYMPQASQFYAKYGYLMAVSSFALLIQSGALVLRQAGDMRAELYVTELGYESVSQDRRNSTGNVTS